MTAYSGGRQAALRRYEEAHPGRSVELARLRAIEQRAKARQYVIDQKTGKACVDCGVVYPHYVMDWDHRGDDTKVSSVAKMVSLGRPVSVIADEIAKCDLRCANCHRIKTWGQA